MLYNPNQIMTVAYTNWKGVKSIRRVVPVSAPYYGHNEFHPGDQWLMEVWDVEKKAKRVFALRDCDFTVLPEKV